MDRLVVPAALRAHVEAAGDPSVAPWRERAPEVVAELCTRWQVNIQEVRTTTRTLLARVVDVRGRSMALAVRATSDGWELALDAFDEAGIGPGLLAVARDHNALLTTWQTGRPLSRRTVTAEHTRIMTRALCRVNTVGGPAGAPDAGATIICAVRRARSAARLEAAPFPGALLAGDEALLTERLRPAPGLLHGHLSTGRVLQTRTGLVVLEPEPATGPVEVDLAQWCWAAAGPTSQLGMHLGEVLAAAPWVDRYLVGRLLTCQARLRAVDMQTRGHRPPTALVGLARQATA